MSFKKSFVTFFVCGVIFFLFYNAYILQIIDNSLINFRPDQQFNFNFNTTDHQYVDSKASRIAYNMLSYNISITEIWFNVFLIHFVERELHHTFTYEHDNNSIFNKQNLGQLSKDIRPLLHITSNSSQLHSNDIEPTAYHQILSLKRYVSILCTYNAINCEELIKQIEARLQILHTLLNRDGFAYFNIHLSKSAGTSICNTFKMNNISVDRHNCNTKGNGAVFFTKNTGSYEPTCSAQYAAVERSGYGMVAREAPMHGNGIYLHPVLCSKFIYILAVRQPTERILSATQMMHGMFSKELNKYTPFAHLQKVKNVIVNMQRWKESFRDKNVYDKLLNADYAKWERFNSMYKDILMAFTSNSLLRYIGFEKKLKNRYTKNIGNRKKSSYHAIAASVNAVNNKTNDIHFYNAIKYMMQIDYVLPFSSLNNSLSTSNLKIWNVLLNDICNHFDKLNTTFIQWTHKGNRTGDRKDVISYLSEKDIYALKQYNYYDYKLFLLSQWIAKTQ